MLLHAYYFSILDVFAFFSIFFLQSSNHHSFPSNTVVDYNSYSAINRFSISHDNNIKQQQTTKTMANNKAVIHTYHPAKCLKSNSIHDKVRSDFDVFHEIRLFLEDLSASEPHCISITGRLRTLQCCCFSIFQNSAVACSVACFVMMFAKKKTVDQKTIIVEWLRYSQG